MLFQIHLPFAQKAWKLFFLSVTPGFFARALLFGVAGHVMLGATKELVWFVGIELNWTAL
jgi:hypothetical protein